MKATYCVFSDGRNDGLIPETFLERAQVYFMALFQPMRYRLGSANGQFCVWRVPQRRGGEHG